MDAALTRDRYVFALHAAVTDFGERITRGTLDAPVPTCPGWDLGDLAGHLGVVHRWALAALQSDTPPEEGDPPPRASLVEWFRDGGAQLTHALAGVDPDRPCWGFGPKPRTAAFWIRRQAHESTLHGWDAATALGEAVRLDPALAADGVDEVAGLFYPRQVRLGRRDPLGLAVALISTDVGTTSVLGEGEPVATLSGPAEPMLLGLWGRRPLDTLLQDGTLAVAGDVPAALAALSTRLTP